MQERRDAGKEENIGKKKVFRKVGIQERRDLENMVCWKGKIQERRVLVK